MLPGRLEAPLGHPGPSRPVALDSPEQPAPPLAPRTPQDQLTWTADGSSQLSWSLARRRALGPRRAVGATGRGGAAAWRDGVWSRSPPPLTSPARLAQVACAGAAALCCAALDGAFGAGAPLAAAPPSVQARAGTGASAGLDATFLIGIPPRPVGSVRHALHGSTTHLPFGARRSPHYPSPQPAPPPRPHP